MAIWYRASQSEHKQVVYSGDGGMFTAGRWNYLGAKAVYCSESLALCTLEWLANHGLSVSGFCYYRYSIFIPDELVLTLAIVDMPENWSATPATNMTREIVRKALFDTDEFLAVSIPSVLVPEERNLIINPLHKAYAETLKSAKCVGRHVGPDN